MTSSLLYVSRRLASPADVADILRVSQSRNAGLGITGALVASSQHFAQVLEGRRAAIDELMTSITNDARHAHVRVIFYRDTAGRAFHDWTMAYAGEIGFVDRQIAPLMEESPHPQDGVHVRRLMELMRELVQSAT